MTVIGPLGEARLAACGCDYVHLVGVDVLQGDHVTEFRRATTRRRPAQNPGRGSVITLRLADKNGHVFALAFGFHKGTVYVQRNECQPCGDMPFTLWRN